MTGEHELLEAISLPRDWQPILADYCHQAGVEFLSTPFDHQAVQAWANSLGTESPLPVPH